MATINVSNLVLTMQQKISTSTNEQDLFYYSKVLQQLRSGKVYVIAQTSNLPAASSNVGELYYVSSNRTLYYPNLLLGWVSVATTNVTLLYLVGNGRCGALGDNNTTNRSSPVREISSSTTWCQAPGGFYHTAALKTDGTLWSWGYNSNGQLGTNTVTTTTSSPVREITSSTTWCQVSARETRTTALKTDGTLWAWGGNSSGRLGDNTTVNKSSPVREITSSTTWCQVSAGPSHTSAVKTDRSLWSWGNNGFGRLGNNSTVDRCSPVREISSSTTWCQVTGGQYHTAALKTDGSLWAWGNSGYGQLGNNSTVDRCSPVREITSSTTWCQVSAGYRHTTALKTDGTLWAWGVNSCGQLGDNTTVNKSSPVREITSSSSWCQVSAGGSHTSAVKTDSSLWSWGNNGAGRLGDNTTVNKSSPVREISSSSSWCRVFAGRDQTNAIARVG
jgi:alpha-tubulin suppressor-like RCC1 family protein